MTLFAALALLASACLVPPRSAILLTPDDGPDPSWAPIFWSTAEVYATNIPSIDPNCHDQGHLDCVWVPSFTFHMDQPPSGTPARFNALEKLPDVAQGDLWAPSVRRIDGGGSNPEYLMLFSESMPLISGSATDHHANCIGAARSTDGLHFKPINSWTFCDPDPSVGMLDPYIFVDPTTSNVWMYYSRSSSPGGLGHSEIDAVQINASAIYNKLTNCNYPMPDCGIVGQQGNAWYPFKIVSFSDVIGFVGNGGASAVVENPSFTLDNYNGFDLTVSVGDWRSNATYNTVEIPCLAVNGTCFPTKGGLIMSGSGGASALVDTSPSSNWLIWHQWNSSSTARSEFAGITSEQNLNSTVAAAPTLSQGSLPGDGALPIQAAGPLEPTLPGVEEPRVRLPGEGNWLVTPRGVMHIPASIHSFNEWKQAGRPLLRRN